MKKILLITALFAVSVSTFAQKRTSTAARTSSSSTSEFKPTQGTITAEVGITGGILSTTPVLNETAAKFRYFFKDDIAFRLGLGIASDKKETVTGTSPFTDTETAKYGSKTFNLGVEKHFSGAERLSTYVGFDLLLGFSSASNTLVEVRPSSTTTTTVEGSDTNGKRAGSSFGFRVTTGADYYFSKKLYLGVEVGLGYKSGTDDQVSTNVLSASTNINTINAIEGKSSQSFTNVIGGLKLGYQF